MTEKTTKNIIGDISKEFNELINVFAALGDETRQKIFFALGEAYYPGLRVGDITSIVHLSRPAVSHHLKIMKDAGIICIDRQGTKNYYHLAISEKIWEEAKKLYNNMDDLINFINNAEEYKKIKEKCKKRGIY